jgi:hypothetical protein|tara:strand:- start:246 stop:785 length:540 start_codon:yes stop_codon:yes gene_type:complete
MSDSIKKYAEMQEQTKKYISEELIEERLMMKGFSEQDSHDPEHVMDSVCKHFDLTLTDDWSTGLDYYIYEDTTADGYEVFVATHDAGSVCVSENVYQYESQLSSVLVDAIINADHGDAKIYLSSLYDNPSWIEEAIAELYISLIQSYTEDIKDKLQDEGYLLPTDTSGVDLLNLIANND